MTPEPASAEPIPFRMLVDEAMKHTRGNFLTIYPSVAIPLCLLYGLLTLAQHAWMRDMIGGAALSGSPSFFIASCAAFAVALFFLLIVQTFAYYAMIAAGVEIFDGRTADMKRCWRFAVRLRSLWTFFLMWVCIGASALLLFFPAIYVSLVLSLVIPVMAAEKLSGWQALRRSADLVRYNPQRRFLDNPKVKVFLLFLIGVVIAYVASLIVQIPFSLLQGVLVARKVSEGATADPAAVATGFLWLQVPSAMLGSLASTAVSVYTSLGLALLYFDVRRRKEGADLEAAIASRAGAGSSPPPDRFGPPPAPGGASA